MPVTADTLTFDASGTPTRGQCGWNFGPTGLVRVQSAQALRPDILRMRDQCVAVQGECQVLELGFGIGVNLLTTWQTWADAESGNDACLTYTAVEPVPLPSAAIADALTRYGFNATLVNHLCRLWPLPLPGLHRIRLAPNLRLHLLFGDLPGALLRAQLQPSLVLISDGGVLSQAPTNRRRLAARLTGICTARTRLLASALPPAWLELFATAGFAPQEKHQSGAILNERVAGHWRTHFLRAQQERRMPQTVVQSANRTVMIVGAGLAGQSIAAALQANGYQVCIVEQHDTQIDARSPDWPQHQPAVAAHVHLAADDNLLARLTRAALALCGKHVGELRRPGRLVLDGPDPAQREQAIRMLSDLPAAFARHVTQDQAADIAGAKLASGGIWLPDLPLRISTDQARFSPGPTTRVLARAQRLERGNGHWLAFDHSGHHIASADRVILATGTLPGLARLSGCMPGVDPSGLVVAGQSSRLGAPANSLRTVVSGRRYVVPLPDGDWLIGASYRTDDTGIHASRLTPGSAPLLDSDNDSNLAVLPSLFEGAHRFNIRDVTGYAGHRVMLPDRLPMIGPAPDVAAIKMQYSDLAKNDRLALPFLPGVFIAAGFGSRGLLWSALAAEVIVDLFDNRVPALETDLMAAIAPDRFLRRSLRRQQQP